MTDIAGKTIYITRGASGMGLMSGKVLAGLDLNPADAAA
jgi:hypothetical protein